MISKVEQILGMGNLESLFGKLVFRKNEGVSLGFMCYCRWGMLSFLGSH